MNMKKIIALLSIMALLAALSACCKEPDFVDSMIVDMTPGKEVPTSSASEVPIGETDIFPSKDGTTANGLQNITVSYETFTSPNNGDGKYACVKYPILVGTDNDEDINNLLKLKMQNIMTSDISSLFSDSNSYTYEIDDIELTFSNESFASFLCMGTHYSEGRPHPTSFVYTLNLDINQCKLLDSESIITDMYGLSDIYGNGTAFELIYVEREDMKNEITDNSDDILTHLTPVYFIEKDGCAYLAVSVQTIHALGDHAEYMVKVSDIEPMLSKDILKLTKGNK